MHIVHENNFKPTRLPIVGIGNVRVYESININEIKKLDSFKSIYIMPTSLFKANNFPLIINSLYTYSKTDYCLLKTYNNLYNCSFFNIDARKKQRFYKKYGQIQEGDYLQLGKMLVENKVPELELKKYYLDNKQKLILIGMLTVYNNYRYIYSDCDLYECSNKKIEYNKITTECFINKCNDNDFIIKMKDEMLAFIEKNSIKGEILSFNITNTEEISN